MILGKQRKTQFPIHTEVLEQLDSISPLYQRKIQSSPVMRFQMPVVTRRQSRLLVPELFSPT